MSGALFETGLFWEGPYLRAGSYQRGDAGDLIEDLR